MSPRKVRLAVDVIRGLGVAEAETRLSVMKQLSAEPVKKLLKSAVANAEHNFKLSSEALYVKTITADGGPVAKRWTPKAFGRATPIRHRTTHISLTLSEREVKEEVADKKTTKKKTSSAKKSAAKQVSTAAVSKDEGSKQ
ncbi:MAG: LSU ribosomal protein L22p (L17e) [Candidatus Uhrbacteria bacterium GW2011_GWE2_45_35]|nr:MAG: LSU ribosomal protein L22p (L17e) [Candidatus Uhrbacteria bacterium GW2011_GWE2_45_35]